jgi:hypothetical protein
MRNVRSLLAITAVSLVAVGCLKEQQPAAQQPQAPVAQPPVAEAPVEQPAPATPPAEEQAPQAPPAETGMAQPGAEQQQAQPPIAQSTHDLVIDALLCGLPPGPMALTMGGGQAEPGAGQPAGEGATGTAGAPGGARCDSLAPNVSATDFRGLDENAIRAVRDQIERRASEERLDDTMRMHLLALYDRGIAAEREALAGEKVGDRYAVMGAQRTAKQRPHAKATGREGNAAGAGIRQQQQQAGRGAGMGQRTPAIEPTDVAALASHDRLRDLLQFARTSDAGALGTEAEGLAWVLGSDRFVQVEALPPRLKVFAAEPLFDALLGVPTPPQAQTEDVTKVTPAVWSQYLETAARTVGMGAPQSPTGELDDNPYLDESANAKHAAKAQEHAQNRPHAQHHRGHRGAIGGGQGAAHPARPGAGAGATGATHPIRRGPAGQSARDQENMREILTAVSQRMEALSRRMPASDLRIALDTYATELQSSQIGVGGGPQAPTRPHRGGGGGGTMGPGGGGTMAPGGGTMGPGGGTMGPGGTEPTPGTMQPQEPQQHPGGTGYPSGAQPGTPSPLAPPAGNPNPNR